MNGKTLTAEQCSKLSLYILMTTKTREGEAESAARPRTPKSSSLA